MRASAARNENAHATGRRIAAALTAGALLVTLGACSASTATPAQTGTPTAATTAASDPVATTEEPTTPAVVDAAVGETVTAEQAELLPEGKAAAPLTDGTLVVVDTTQPLPERVVADIQSQFNGAPQKHDQSAGEAVHTQATNVARHTGRHSILVRQAGSYDGDGNLLRSYWTVVATGDAFMILASGGEDAAARQGSREHAIAIANELLGRVEDPASYQIIVESD